MLVKKLTTELMVEDVNKTVDYYVNTLGFSLTNHVGEKPMIWAQINFGEIAIMLMEEKALGEDIKNLRTKRWVEAWCYLLKLKELRNFMKR